MIRYTVIIPYRDRPLLLNKALRSIPDREDIQIVVINNNDFPFDKECDFSREKSSVLLLQHPGGGPGGAINAAWGSIQGRFTLFLDADDCFAPGAFDAFDKYSDGAYDMVFFKLDSINLSTGKQADRHSAYNAVIDRYFNTYEEKDLRYRFGTCCAKLYRTAFLKDNGIEVGEGAGGDVLFSAVAGYYAGAIAVSDKVVYVISSRGEKPSFTESFNADDRFNKYRMYVRKHVFLREHGIRISDPVYRFVFTALLRYGFREANRYLVLAKDSKLSFLRIFFDRVKRFSGIETLHDILRPLKHKFDKIYFEVHVTDHCNLNCAYCSHFSPLAEPHFCSLEGFRRDMGRMKELFPGHQVRRIRLLGGEPLLHPEMCNFIRCAYETFPETERQIVTNGILLPDQRDEFWNTVKSTGTIIFVSQYPILQDYVAIESLMQKKGVRYCIETDSGNGFHKDILNERGIMGPLRNWLHCNIAVRCSQLRDGKLFMCCKPAYVDIINKAFSKDYKVVEKDYVDIYRPDADNAIRRYLCRPVPFCRYCNTKRTVFVPWRKSERKIEEWQ